MSTKLTLPGDPGFNQLSQATGSGLVFVQADAEWSIHRRAGRFTISADEASSATHLFAAIARQQEKMIAGLAKRGFEYMGRDFELRGPLDHVEISENDAADPGPAAHPDPRDVEANDAFSRAEQARVARKLGHAAHLVDYELVTDFRKRAPRSFRRAA